MYDNVIDDNTLNMRILSIVNIQDRVEEALQTVQSIQDESVKYGDEPHRRSGANRSGTIQNSQTATKNEKTNAAA